MATVVGEKGLILDQGGRQVVFRVDETGFWAPTVGVHFSIVKELQQRVLQMELHLLRGSKQVQEIHAGDLLRQVQEIRGRKVTTHKSRGSTVDHFFMRRYAP